MWGGGERAYLLRELFVDGNVRALLCDNYANYVLQTALQSSHPRERRRLVLLVQPHLDVFLSAGTPAAVGADPSV